MNRTCRYLLPLLLSIPFAYAQSTAEVDVGFGTYHDSAATTGVDSNGNACTSGTSCAKFPALSGFFMGFGGTIMLSKHTGFGGEVTLQPAKQNYSAVSDLYGNAYPLKSRQIFYDVNGIYAPINEKKAILRLEGGIGGATTRFSVTSSSCVGTAVCQNSTQPYASSNHFQIHAGVGVQLYLTEHFSIRPQVDIHYVPSFTNQFGSNLCPGAMVWIGYGTGDR